MRGKLMEELARNAFIKCFIKYSLLYFLQSYIFLKTQMNI